MLDRGDSLETCEVSSEEWQQLTDGLTCSDAVRNEWERFHQSTGMLPVSLNDQRRFPRFFAASSAVLEYRHSIPAIPRPERKCLVLTKNLSRDGLGFLHDEMLFPNEVMLLHLPSGVQLEIRVMRCIRCIAGCFEIGAQFVTVGR